jgi:molybdopterin-guanine dinucleotide biosynthesis protein A
MPFSPSQVCAVVLAGGRGSRMGGVDKGLQIFRGQALAQHAIARLQAQTGGAPGLIGVNANRHAAQYAAWGLPLWPDVQADYPGPLAGFLAALQHNAALAQPYPYLLTVPCDSPLFSLDLLQRLAHGLHAEQADIAVAYALEAPEHNDGNGNGNGNGNSNSNSNSNKNNSDTLQLRSQPVFCLFKTALYPSLLQFIDQGRRKIDAWTAQHPCAHVAFSSPEDTLAFSNANTLEQLSQLERL